jgi:hypothetical protein
MIHTGAAHGGIEEHKTGCGICGIKDFLRGDYVHSRGTVASGDKDAPIYERGRHIHARLAEYIQSLVVSRTTLVMLVL